MVCVVFEILHWNWKLLNSNLCCCLAKHKQTHELDSLLTQCTSLDS